MTLGAPSYGHLAWLLPVLVLVLVLASASRRRALSALLLAAPQGLERRRALQSTLVVLGLACVVFAALQPRWGYTWREFESQGVEVVFALDLSRSMDAEDVRPSRLERARHEIEDLSEALGGSRMGLVIFAAGAYPRVPLTQDRSALLHMLDDCETSTLRAQGSSLKEGLSVALDLLDDGREGDAAIIVLSDGEAWEGELEAVLSRAVEQRVRVYSVAIGTMEGAPIPMAEGGFKTWQGEVVVSRRNDEALKAIAAQTGGAFIESVAGGADSLLLATELMTTLSAESEQVRRQKVWDERYQWPLGAGIALLGLAWMVGDGRRFALLGLLLATQAQAADLDEAYTLMDAGRHDEAVEVLTSLQIDDPDDPYVQTALADSLYKSGRYEESAEAWEDVAARSGDPDLQQLAHYNAAHARYREGQLERAAEHFEAAGPVDGAKENAEQVRKEIEERRRPPQDPESQPQQGEQQPQEGEPQEGEPQEGQEGQPQEPQEGQPQEPEQQQQDQAGQQPDSSGEQSSQEHDGTRPEDEGEGSEEPPQGGSSGEQTPDAEGAPVAAGGPGDEGEGMSPEQARRLIDGVEEGEPRVVVRGESKGKDW